GPLSPSATYSPLDHPTSMSPSPPGPAAAAGVESASTAPRPSTPTTAPPPTASRSPRWPAPSSTTPRSRTRTSSPARSRRPSGGSVSTCGRSMRSGRRRGLKALDATLEAYRPSAVVIRSALERRFLRICHDAGLPAPAMNSWVLEYEVDAFWAEYGVAVELDGRPH